VKRSLFWFSLISLLHIAALSVAFSLTSAPVAKTIEKSISGVIIPLPPTPAVEPPKAKPVQAEKPKPQPKTKPVVKPTPKPVAKPLAAPKAPASERAVQAAPETAKPTPPAPTTPPAVAKPEPQSSPPVAVASTAVNKAPLYPKLSRKLKEQGTVYLNVLVLKNGKVGDLNLQQSSGFSRLDQAAINAVRHWQFEPAKQLGQPVDLWFVQPVVFQLNKINE